MSASRISLCLQLAMLDGRKECVPGFEDSSGGYILFSSSCKTKCNGPSSWTFDELDVPYNKEDWVTSIVDLIKRELIIDAGMGDRMLRALVGSLLDQSKAHCDEHHADQREKFRKKS